MPSKNLDYKSVSGIIDVGIIVVAHFNNPIKDDMIDFLRPVITWQKKILIPNTSFLGAFHILTSYLRVSKVDAKNALIKTFLVDSPCFISDISKPIISEALEQATCYNVESWDGYLVSLGKIFETNIVYSIDKKISKVKEINVINPIDETKMKNYHEWLRSHLERN